MYSRGHRKLQYPSEYSEREEDSDCSLEAMQNQDSHIPTATSRSMWISSFNIHNEVITDLGVSSQSERRLSTSNKIRKAELFLKNLNKSAATLLCDSEGGTST